MSPLNVLTSHTLSYRPSPTERQLIPVAFVSEKWFEISCWRPEGLVHFLWVEETSWIHALVGTGPLCPFANHRLSLATSIPVVILPHFGNRRELGICLFLWHDYAPFRIVRSDEKGLRHPVHCIIRSISRWDKRLIMYISVLISYTTVYLQLMISLFISGTFSWIFISYTDSLLLWTSQGVKERFHLTCDIFLCMANVCQNGLHFKFKAWKLNTCSGPTVLLEARGEV